MANNSIINKYRLALPIGYLPKLAVVDYSGKIPYTELKAAAEAIDYQVNYHVKPAWGKGAQVLAALPDNIPVDAWIVAIRDEIFDQNGNKLDLYGYHDVNSAGIPYAEMRYADDWSIVLSHEVVETVVNPWTDFVLSSEDFEEYETIEGQTNQVDEKIDVLVEIADPTQDGAFSYLINGVRVSNFYYPSYFNLTTYGSASIRYDYLGVITKPKEILEGGYLSFRTRLGEWVQARVSLGVTYYQRLTDGNIQLGTAAIVGISAGALGIGFLFYYLLSASDKKKARRRRK